MRCRSMTGVVSWQCLCLGRNGNSGTCLLRTMLRYSIKSLFFFSSLIFMYFQVNNSAFKVRIIIEFSVVERFVAGSKVIKSLVLNSKTMMFVNS